MLLLLGAATALGCKSAKEREEARQARALIESKADLRDRLHKRRIARKEKKEFLKSHPELVSADVPPDPAHRPTAEPSPNIPPQLMGATPPPPPEPPLQKVKRPR
jgi:hypothetical protein